MKAQIVAKEQAKKEAKERAELEARREEVRLAKERERMKEDHQNEIEKARKKEVRALAAVKLVTMISSITCLIGCKIFAIDHHSLCNLATHQ